MNILGIDTSYNVHSIAIADNNKISAAIARPCNTAGHAPDLIAMLEEVLNSAGLKIKNIDAIAVTKGPGSFTGVRIGLALARGLSMGVNTTIIGIPTLDALALSFPQSPVYICPVLDARKKEIYAAFYKTEPRKKQTIKISRYMVLSPEKLVELINQKYKNKKIILSGPGACVYRKFLEDNLEKDKTTLLDNFPGASTAASAALLGYKKIIRPDFKPLKNIVPIYLRKSEAEIVKSQRKTF